ncbi:hypothetical protein INR49_011567 [Caranx melampygus]|nr:hypothetical protein INR49_011567 [Caranx melampygus]
MPKCDSVVAPSQGKTYCIVLCSSVQVVVVSIDGKCSSKLSSNPDCREEYLTWRLLLLLMSMNRCSASTPSCTTSDRNRRRVHQSYSTSLVFATRTRWMIYFPTHWCCVLAGVHPNGDQPVCIPKAVRVSFLSGKTAPSCLASVMAAVVLIVDCFIQDEVLLSRYGNHLQEACVRCCMCSCHTSVSVNRMLPGDLLAHQRPACFFCRQRPQQLVTQVCQRRIVLKVLSHSLMRYKLPPAFSGRQQLNTVPFHQCRRVERRILHIWQTINLSLIKKRNTWISNCDLCHLQRAYNHLCPVLCINEAKLNFTLKTLAVI